MGSVNGKVVFITGGARGIGAEVARRLHAKGAKLVLTDLDEARAERVGRRAGRRPGGHRRGRRPRPRGDAGGGRTRRRTVRRHRRRDRQCGHLQLRIGAQRRSRGVQARDRRQRRSASSTPCGRRCRRCSSAAATCWSCRRSRRSPPRPAWPPTTRRRPAIEHFANALRLEVAHRGVDVGSAHMSWIDTPARAGRQGPTCLPSARCSPGCRAR